MQSSTGICVGYVVCGWPLRDLPLTCPLQSPKSPAAGASLPELTAPSAFHDITSGDNKVPCLAGTPQCSSGATIGYSAGTGYDQASGLGSVDIYSLSTNWPGYSTNPNYSLSSSPTSATLSVAGQSATTTITVASTGGYSGTIALSCSVSSSTAKIGCSLSPTSVTLDGSTASPTSTLTVSTAASRVRPVMSTAIRNTWLGGTGAATLGLVMVGLPLWRRSQRIMVLGFLLLTAIGLISCGGGSNNGHRRATYTVTVTGTSDSTTRTTTTTIIVQ